MELGGCHCQRGDHPGKCQVAVDQTFIVTNLHFTVDRQFLDLLLTRRAKDRINLGFDKALIAFF